MVLQVCRSQPNVVADELSPAEIDELFAAQGPPAADTNHSDIDDFCSSSEGSRSQHPVHSNGTPFEELLEAVRGLEDTVAGIDDATVSTRDMLSDLGVDMKTTQCQVENINEMMSMVKIQNAMVTKEVGEVHKMVVAMREQISILINLAAPPTPPQPPTEVTTIGT